MTPPPPGSPTSRPSPSARATRLLAAFTSARGRYRVLRLTTLAFFVSFVVWFDMAPFLRQIGAQMHLTKAQLLTLTLCNLALAVPGRVTAGMLVDRFGPRRVYSAILIFAAVPNTVFATATSFPVLVLSRLALGLVGSGFVVGVRMIAEWFDGGEIGSVEGLYGGWGNFGSAAAGLALPGLSLIIAGQAGWRWGIGLAGAISAAYGLVYLVAVRDTPDGVIYRRPRRQGALEVASRGALWALLALQMPPAAVLVLVAYRIEQARVIGTAAFAAVSAVVAAAYLAQAARAVSVNRPALSGASATRDVYPFRLVAMLSVAYFVTFGTELAMTSLLPAYFAGTFGLGLAAAGAAGSAFAFTNLVTRPFGGLLSDMSRRRSMALAILLSGAVVAFAAMSRMGSGWRVWEAVGLVALSSVFIQGGNGAVYAMVPLVSRRHGGQIAGLAGAYGNVGGLAFTSLLAFDGGRTDMLFAVIAACAAAVALLAWRWMPEPGAATGVADGARAPAAAGSGRAETAQDEPGHSGMISEGVAHP